MMISKVFIVFVPILLTPKYGEDSSYHLSIKNIPYEGIDDFFLL